MLQERGICSIYDDDDDTFRVGYLIVADDQEAIFNLYTTRGYEDGLYLTQISDIFRVDYDNAYVKRIEKLSQLVENENNKIDFKPRGDLSKSLLDYAKENKFIVTIRMITGDAVTGEIFSIDEQYLGLYVINEDGQSDGKAIIRTETISRIWCNSGYERNVLLLKEHR